MRHLLMLASVFALCACETMPEFMQTPASTTSSGANTASAAATPAAYGPPPQQQLLELERQLSATAQQSGLGGALSANMHPEGMVIRPGVTLTGAEAVARGLATPAGAGPMYWQPDRVEVSNSGDMGMTSGRYVQVVTGSEAIQGRYVVVWRRDSDGQWKILTETRIPDPARAARRR